MRKISRLLTLLTIASLTFGCASNKMRHHPADTALGSLHDQRPDWIDNESVYTEQGLSLRSNNSSLNGKSIEQIASTTPIASIYFDFDRSNINAKERSKLSQTLASVQKNQSLLLVGHCDWRGTQEYNLALGDRRANSVRSYLTSLGENSQKLSTLSKGSLKAHPHANSQQCAKDRRVDIIVMD